MVLELSLPTFFLCHQITLTRNTACLISTGNFQHVRIPFGYQILGTHSQIVKIYPATAIFSHKLSSTSTYSELLRPRPDIEYENKIQIDIFTNL